ncbi:MAG TPA: response regulator [Longimicrobiales bacterium]
MPPKKVLVADDHVDTREICRQLLTHYGYEVLLACDGLEAVDIAVAEVPDMVLLDFLMPRADGVETLRRLREHEALRAKPIVVFTAAATHVHELSMLEGVDRVLLKPIEARGVLKVVRELIGDSELEPLA